MKQKITLLVFSILFASLTYAQDPRFQVIHNSADAALSEVDVYATTFLGTKKVLDNVGFRTASTFEEGPANVAVTIHIAPGNSTSKDDAIISKTITLDSGKTYVFVAEGIHSSSGYNPSQPLELHAYELGRESANSVLNTDILVHHGATDAPTVDINNVTGGTSSVLVNDISYSEFSANYLELPTADYQINVTTADGNTVVKTYNAPLGTLGLTGQAITIVASGFLNPSNNSNGPEFGLWVATTAGEDLIELEEVLSVDKFNFSASNLYPNPVSQTLTINVDEFKNIEAKIMDAYGRKITTANLTSNQTRIDVSDLASGLYFVQLSDNTSASKAVKILVE